jgi:hypothetical protein
MKSRRNFDRFELSMAAKNVPVASEAFTRVKEMCLKAVSVQERLKTDHGLYTHTFWGYKIRIINLQHEP